MSRALQSVQSGYSLDGLAVLGVYPLAVNIQTERDLDLPLEGGVVELVGESRGGHFALIIYKESFGLKKEENR